MNSRFSRLRVLLLLIFAFFGWAGTDAWAAIPSLERTVLLNIYSSTNGASWKNSTNWNGAGGTECTWFGVTCDADEAHVLSIILITNQLSGTLPDLSNLTNLQRFDLSNGTTGVSNNQITGSIPPLPGLTNFQYFNVSNSSFPGNGFTGSIPSLSGLTNLQYFNVRNNQLTGSIPSLSGLTSLNIFDVAMNHLTGSIPSLNGLTSLALFDVRNNQLTGSIPSLSGLTSLNGFYLSFNQLTGTIPSLNGLTSLHGFYVDSNQLTGAIPSLNGLTGLHGIDVAFNQLTGDIPAVPSPNALFAGASTLCPNYLNHTSDPAWDTATGSTPWYMDCTAGPPIGVVSRKVHGSAGTFDLPLSLVTTNPTTEPRTGPTHTIVFTFASTVTGATATITEGVATADTPTFSGNDVIVAITGVADQQYVTVTLSNVATDNGTGSGSVRIGFLKGDVNQNRVVTVADLGQVNAQLAQFVTQANFLKDVNASGTLSVADKGITNANLTRNLPAP